MDILVWGIIKTINFMFWCCGPLYTLFFKWKTARDPFTKKMKKMSKDMANKDLKDKTHLYDDFRELMNQERISMKLWRYKYVNPKEYVIKKGSPPYPRPDRVFRYVDDYYTTLWDFNSVVCRCCSERKPIQVFKVKRHDYRRRGLIKHSSSCKDCLESHKKYMKSIFIVERFAHRIERLLTPLSKKDKEIRAHNSKLDALSEEGLRELQ